jgi:hypothetical protein
VNLWEYIEVVTTVSPVAIAASVAPGDATPDEVQASADLLRKRPLAWAWGLDHVGQSRLADICRRNAASKERR